MAELIPSSYDKQVDVSRGQENVKQQDPIGSVTPESIRKIAYDFQTSRVLLTAYELGVFTALGAVQRASAEVAIETGTDARAVDRLLNALVAMGLVTKHEGKFANTESSQRFLVRGQQGYIAGLMHTVNLWDTWSTLTAAVRKGTAVAHRETNERGENWLTSFIAAMHDRASKQAPGCVARLDLSGVSRVLDVGGGSGAYSMAFVRARRGITATVFDLPNVVPLTGQYVEKEGLTGKVTTSVGDYNRDVLGEGYDLVFLSAIIHSNSPEENRTLIAKSAQALNTGGQVVVQDFIMDEDRTSPLHGALFALNMLVGTSAGDTYTESEVREWMTDAGLTRITRNETGFGTTQIVGVRA